MKKKELTKEELKAHIEKEISRLWESYDIDYKKMIKWYVPKYGTEEQVKEIYDELLSEGKYKLVNGVLKPAKMVIDINGEVKVTDFDEKKYKKISRIKILDALGFALMGGGILTAIFVRSDFVYGIIFAVIGLVLFVTAFILKKRENK